MSHITNLPTYEEATEAVKAGTATALDRFIYSNEPAGPTEEEFREGLLAALDEARAELSPATAQSAPIEAIQLVCDALTAIVANSGDPAGTVNTLAQWRTRAEAFIQNHGKPQEAVQQPISTHPATAPDGWRDVIGKVYRFMQDTGEHGVTCAIYDLDEDGKHIQCSCGMDETLRSLNALLAAAPSPAQVEQQARDKWQPIGTAPTDGRTILLGHFNSHGNWRTMRGQWFTKEHIEDNWEDGDLFEAGWYETSVEADDAPSCRPTKPTYWQPLPGAPTQEAGARLAAEAKGGSDANH